MYDQAVTFLGDIFVTFCPNGATDMVSIACREHFFSAFPCAYVCVDARASALTTLPVGHEVQQIVLVSLKVMLSVVLIQMLQYEFNSRSVKCMCMCVGLWLLVRAGGLRLP